jgi:acetyl esterase/lipase
MSPENSFPTPIIDCYKVTLHVMQNFKEYGVDLSKLVLAGDSAGERK